jgi:phosphatidylserine decarboxylase
MTAFRKSDSWRALDYLRVFPQYVYPHHLLSRLAFHVTRIRYAPIRKRLIGWFVYHYRVTLDEAVYGNIADYPDFNSFFTRRLHPGARPLATDPAAIVSPVDGNISQLGQIERDCLLQAKGRMYRLADLFGGHQSWTETFLDGRFVTIYLAPRDYHRVHMPVSGKVIEMFHVPGRLFSVNPSTSRMVNSLFTRNERVITLFEGPKSPFALVLVGALLVGSIETVWAGPVTPTGSRFPWLKCHGSKPEQPLVLARGAEVARFNMGSTVILLFPAGTAEWQPDLGAGTRVVVGQCIGEIASLK